MSLSYSILEYEFYKTNFFNTSDPQLYTPKTSSPVLHINSNLYVCNYIFPPIFFRIPRSWYTWKPLHRLSFVDVEPSKERHGWPECRKDTYATDGESELPALRLERRHISDKQSRASNVVRGQIVSFLEYQNKSKRDDDGDVGRFERFGDSVALLRFLRELREWEVMFCE